LERFDSFFSNREFFDKHEKRMGKEQVEDFFWKGVPEGLKAGIQTLADFNKLETQPPPRRGRGQKKGQTSEDDFDRFLHPFLDMVYDCGGSWSFAKDPPSGTLKDALVLLRASRCLPKGTIPPEEKLPLSRIQNIRKEVYDRYRKVAIYFCEHLDSFCDLCKPNIDKAEAYQRLAHERYKTDQDHWLAINEFAGGDSVVGFYYLQSPHRYVLDLLYGRGPRRNDGSHLVLGRSSHNLAYFDVMRHAQSFGVTFSAAEARRIAIMSRG
jgi:hypothetical protein